MKESIDGSMINQWMDGWINKWIKQSHYLPLHHLIHEYYNIQTWANDGEMTAHVKISGTNLHLESIANNLPSIGLCWFSAMICGPHGWDYNPMSTKDNE